MPRQLRLTLLLLGVFAAAVALVAAITLYLLLQPERFTGMLQKQAHALGLELNLARPASPTLFPRPALDLDGITLNAEGASVPILLAARGQLALPWRTLFGGPTVISELQIDSPRVDLDALQGWISNLPERSAGTPPNIPRIDTGVSINHGTVVSGNKLLLGNVSLTAGNLMTGQPFPLAISTNTSSGTPIQLRLSATPRIQGNTLQLDKIELNASQGDKVRMQLKGSAHWHGAADAAANLAGNLYHGTDQPYNIALTLAPANQHDPLLLALKLDGPDNHADLRLPPLGLVQWWDALGDENNPQLSVPPGDGQIDIAEISTDSVSIKGLSIQAGSAIPVSASSAAATADIPGKQP